MNDRAYFTLLVIAVGLLAFSAGHHVGYQDGYDTGKQTVEQGYVTCNSGNVTICFTSGDVQFEWMENATTRTRNGTMNLKAINESEVN